MDTFEQLNPALASPLVVREGKAYRLPLHALCTAGFLPSVRVEGEAIVARVEDLVKEAEAAAERELDSALPIGGPSQASLMIEATRHGEATLIVRHARPWLGEEDPLATELRIQVQVVSEAVQQAWEDQVPVSPVSDEEVRRMLDDLDGSRPYGGKKVQFMRQALDIIAKDIAVRRHAGFAYVLEDWKVEGFAKLLPAAGLRHLGLRRVERALLDFVQGRTG